MSPYGPQVFSRREQQIIALRAEGLRNKEIAAQLDLTPGTVRVYTSRACTRVGANSRELVGRMVRDVYEGRLRVYGIELLRLAEIIPQPQAVTLRDIAGRMLSEVLTRKDVQ